MCELFAMSSRVPSALSYSLNEFATHGGLTYGNKSGWGIAYFADREALLVKEPEPAHNSPWVKFIAEQQLKSRCVIAHVRHATVGEPSLQNTHPFRRELGGNVHVFAHNGTLARLHDDFAGTPLRHEPIGTTDSELAFCLLMERLRSVWAENANGFPPLEDRMAVFKAFAADMSERGSANFLYSDGDVLFAHAHKRIYEENGGYSAPRAPGLSMRNCVACQEGPEFSCAGLKVGLGDRQTVLLASVPLGEGGWDPLPEGTVLAVRDGQAVAMQSI